MVAQTPYNSLKLWAKVADGWLAAKPWIAYVSFCDPWGAGHREGSRDERQREGHGFSSGFPGEGQHFG